MNETEIWGVLTEEQFQKAKEQLTQKYGVPKIKRRLSIEVSDFDNTNLDTRIRITDGKPELMQKVGDWNSETRQEITIPLENDPEIILSTYKILVNMLKNRNMHAYALQHENYVFLTTEFEIKLSHQTGKTSKYPFEIEAIAENVDLYQIAEEYNLEPYIKHKGADFWEKWNNEVNLEIDNKSEKEITDLITSYL